MAGPLYFPPGSLSRQGQRAQPNQSKVLTLQKPRSRNTLRGVVGLSGITKLANDEARSRWRRKLGAADSGVRAGRGK
jgi:hypothetical protein